MSGVSTWDCNSVLTKRKTNKGLALLSLFIDLAYMIPRSLPLWTARGFESFQPPQFRASIFSLYVIVSLSAAELQSRLCADLDSSEKESRPVMNAEVSALPFECL